MRRSSVAVVADMLVRIQDCEGRGPWRPGLSAMWDSGKAQLMPAITEEVPNLKMLMKPGFHYGCAVRVGKVGLWFSEDDLTNLLELGFHFVNATPCAIVIETEYQAVIASIKPLRKLSRIKWQRVLDHING